MSTKLKNTNTHWIDIEKALNDADREARLAAIKSDYFGPEYMERAMNDGHWGVRLAAITSKHFSEKYLMKVLAEGCVIVKEVALRIAKEKEWKIPSTFKI